MNEIREVDRFECRVVNVIKNLMWKGVTVEEKGTKGRVYFSRVNGELDINHGDTLYIGVKPVYEIEGKTMEVTLYDAENKKLDWTLV
ncbi:MAG: hypothetical protein ACOX7X_06325 [Methanosarcina flavescens]|jgi:hypothetical protein|uniref:Uncharacterized protein n=1 Tax=Methanosarcina flavescens TaxID=1715806 RepID=A0A660HPN0_9EURY|nr:hypothetical protein [Methanosarcina flavescens]AYK14241.1 hypothetical protein AOB57_002655 [Methanosarcina flavescens]NLK32936.1 hypothetical protein [Methanosarcina flavescens]